MSLVRRARASEAEEITKLARAAKAAWGYPSEWRAAWREELTIPPEYVERHEVFVVSAGDGLAGVAAIELIRGEAVLEHVWVAATHQGKGVGSALVRHGLALAASSGHKAVRVVADPHAVGFYQRLGGQLTGSIPAPMPGMPHRVLPVLEIVAQR